MKLIGRAGRESATLPISISPDSSLGTVKQKKGKKRLAEVKSFSLEEPLEGDGGEKAERAGSLIRSKTYDQPSSLRTIDDPSADRRRSITSNLPKHNLTFHKIFRDVPEDEELKDSFTCALQREVLYQGRLYISQSHLGFFCSMLRKEIKVLIPVSSVIIVKKANTALLVPNALSVRTIDGDKYLFGSLRNREMCYHAVRSVCANLHDGSTCSTPTISVEPISEMCSKILNSSHSDLEQTPPESDSIENCAKEADVAVMVQNRIRSGNGEVDGQVQDHFLNGDVCREKINSDNSNTQWADPRAVNFLLVVYMLLVLLLLFSSGYIGLRIMELENQLNIMGAWPKGDEAQGVNSALLHGPSNSPILQQAVSFTPGPWGVDVKSNVFYTNKREAFLRWQNEYRQREQAALQPSASQLLRETAWYDPTQPSQQQQDSSRWGTFIWRDQPVLGKEYVVNRHKFGV
ncbi:GRAM domain-containing protein 2A-like isoform X2 [Rhinoderma darwinii]|uniref:GRAM domain-containing protein 2A-like isoform X2 n=1 Tax=Rhinoderma darwinii TaxID=43563 RepID=UPI003F677DDB